MSFLSMRSLRAAAAGLALVSLSACSSVGELLPAGLSDTLTQITGLTSDITGWQSSLQGALDQTGFSQLQGYVDQAKDLGSQVTGFQDQVSGLMADPLSAIGSKLGDMGGLDVSKLKGMAAGEQSKAVEGFSESAGGVGELVEGFLGKFGG